MGSVRHIDMVRNLIKLFENPSNSSGNISSARCLEVLHISAQLIENSSSGSGVTERTRISDRQMYTQLMLRVSFAETLLVPEL